MNKLYPAKLLLFGEYAILAGGEALAIPYPKYNLQWAQHNPAGSVMKQHLVQFASYLESNGFAQTLRIDVLMNDLRSGISVETNIPIGYGLGSSGALVAAVYDRYAVNRIDESNLNELRSTLASMENHFHGKSSGLDPLVCYLQKPVHIETGDRIAVVDEIKPSAWEFDLVDSGTARQTSAMVEQFQTLMSLPVYEERLEKEYFPLVKNCIDFYLHADDDKLDDALSKLSLFQLSSFNFAIPTNMIALWNGGLFSREYMKLCGAGGGGFMIRFNKK